MASNNLTGIPVSISVKSSFRLIYILACFLILFIVTGLSGCVTMSDPEASQVYTAESVDMINQENDIGQTFVSRRPNFNGITIWVTIPANQGSLASTPGINTFQASLYTSPREVIPVYTTLVKAPAAGNNVAITISVPGQKNPAGQGYYLDLSSSSSIIQVNGRNEDAYAQGQAYFNRTPLNADIAFQLSYDYGPAALFQDLKQFFTSSWIILPLLICLWLPGWLLLDISGLDRCFDLAEKIAIAGGLSLAVIPVVMLWTTTLKLPWSQTAVWIVSLVLVGLFIVRSVARYSKTLKTKNAYVEDHEAVSIDQKKTFTRFILNHSTSILIIFILALVIRLIMVRDLATPAWVDSVHHALITHLIMTDGGYPANYLPYLNIPSTDYHPGFHSIAASFTWLSNLALPRSLLVLGQVINAMCVLSVFLLTKTFTRSPLAGVIAGFITGFLTPMPAYYTSWGRYTELTGLVIFPVVLALIQSRIDEPPGRKPGWYLALGALVSAGLFMIHYRVIVFMACLIISFICFSLIFRSIRFGGQLRGMVSLLLGMAGLSLLIILPWIIPMVKNTLLPVLSTSVPVSGSPFKDFPWAYLTSAFGKPAMVLAGLGLIWSIIKRQAVGLVLTTWVFMLFLLANLDSLGLPGGGLITNLSVEIILFIPISILGGYFVSQVFSSWTGVIPGRLTVLAGAIALLIFVFTGYLGSKQLVTILNPATLLSRQADLSAIQWVDKHIPEDETIVINPFSWGYGLYAGSDGGYWLEPLSGRLTIPPPVLYGLGPGYREINQQSQEIITFASDPAGLKDFMTTHDYQYVFVGVKGGVIPPEELSTSGLFDLLYHQDGNWILKLRP